MATYYVDATGGSDASADPTNIATPWQTIAKVNGSTFSAGDSILFKKGEVWREQLTIPSSGTSGNRITFGAYGTGAIPLIDASDEIAAVSWSKTGAQTYVYEATLTPAIAATKTWNSVWEDAVRLVRVASIAACDSTAGSYFPSADVGSGSITMYIHASDDGNPGENGKLYEFASRQFSIDGLSKEYITIDGIRTRRNLGDDGSIRAGKYSIVQNCTIEEGSKHCILLKSGSLLSASTVSGIYYAGATASMITFNEDTPSGAGISVDGCTIDNNGVYAVGASGIGCHYNVSGNFGALAITDTAISDMGSVANLDSSTTTVEISGITIDNCGICFSIASTGGTVSIDNVTVTNIGLASTWRFLSFVGDCAHAITVSNITLDGETNPSTTGTIFVAAGKTVASLTVTDSTFTDGGSDSRFFLAASGTVTNAVFTNVTLNDYQYAFRGDTSSFNITRCTFDSLTQTQIKGRGVFAYNRVLNSNAYVAGTGPWYIYNNLFYAAPAVALRVSESSTGHLIKNNIIAEAGTYGLQIDAGSGATADYNLYYSNATNNYNNISAGANDISADPLFVTAGTDFHLQDESPCVNAGTYLGLTVDFEGKAILGHPDIGAYESDVPDSGGGYGSPYGPYGPYEPY